MKDVYVKERDRSHIPEKYKWDLGDVYRDDAAWQEAKQKLLSDMILIPGFRGKLSEGPDRLFECLNLLYSLRKEYVRLACYASMQSDMDTRNSDYLAMDQETGQIGSDFSSLSSFIEPEILKIGADAIDRFIQQDARLEVYGHIFDDILRKKNHTRSEEEEKIIAEANLMADSPVSINNIFSNADFPHPDVELEDGTTVRLAMANRWASSRSRCRK